MLVSKRLIRFKHSKMGDIELSQESFEINVNLAGTSQAIRVRPQETTDGIEYFSCSIEGKNITQIRMEKEGGWEQIWGELDTKAVETIGQAIIAQKR